MGCPVITIYHRTDGLKELVVEYPPGGAGQRPLKFCQLTVCKLMLELINPRRDGGKVRVAVRG